MMNKFKETIIEDKKLNKIKRKKIKKKKLENIMILKYK